MDVDTLLKDAPLGLAFVATASLIVSILAYRRAGRRQLFITQPDDREVHQERASVSGIGAPVRWKIFRIAPWKILVLHLTNRWFLQEDEAVPDNNGYWIHTNCHFDNSTIGKDRTVVALAVPSRQVERLREAFGGWGPSGNKIHVKDWPALLDLLKKNVGKRYEISKFARIRRVS
jgi:hypothetical protein